MFMIARIKKSRFFRDCRLFTIETYLDLQNSGRLTDTHDDYLIGVNIDFIPVKIKSLKKTHFETYLSNHIHNDLFKRMTNSVIGNRTYSLFDQKNNSMAKKAT